MTINISFPAATALRDDHASERPVEVRDHGVGGLVPYHGADRHTDNQIICRFAVLIAPLAVDAVASSIELLILTIDEGSE